MKKIAARFEKYISKFDLASNEDMRLKQFHTYEVAKQMKDLTNRLNLSQRDKYIALIIAYFHDLGRFPQLKETASYSDKNYDHAKKSVEVLIEEDILEDFDLSEGEKELVRLAIFHHNKLAIGKDLTGRKLHFSKLIRDADKIDIFRVCMQSYKEVLREKISPKVLADFKDYKAINVADASNKSDSILVRLAFLYDIEFNESFKILMENNYFIDYLNSVKSESEDYEMVKEIILKYYEGRLSC